MTTHVPGVACWGGDGQQGPRLPNTRFPCFTCRSVLLVTDVQVRRLCAVVSVLIGWGSFAGSYPYLQLFLFWFDVKKQLCICENVEAHHTDPGKDKCREKSWEALKLSASGYSLALRCSTTIKASKASPWENPEEKGESDSKGSYIIRFRCPVFNKINLKVYKEIEKCGLFRGGGCLVTKSCLTLAALGPVACQAPLPTEFSRQEHWSGVPAPSAGDLPNPGIKPRSPVCRWMDLLTDWANKINEHKLYLRKSRLQIY